MLKLVIFDMDGVLIDSEPDHLKIHDKMLEELGLDPKIVGHSQYIGANTYYKWNDIKNRYGLRHAVEELVDINRQKYFHYITDENTIIEPIVGVDKLVKDIYNNKVKLAVASSSPINVVETVVKAIGLDECFDLLVSGDFVKESKPSPDIFLYAAEKLNINTENCLVIEDSHNGSIAAKKAGMKCIGYKNLNSGNQDLSLADLTIDSFQVLDFKRLKDLF